MNEVTPPDDDDGFSGSLVGGDRLIKGQILRWNETNGWTDRDGLTPPDLLLVLACSEALQCWKNQRPTETITVKPLPDVKTLNAAVPKEDWEPGPDGTPKPPWVHQVIVYLIDPGTAGFYTYLNSTIGARIAVGLLKERVTTMRMLRGGRVLPLVRLIHRPMKTKFGMKHRPEFAIVNWRNPGGGGGKALGEQQPAAIAGPTKPATPSEATVATMEEVTTPTTSEEMGGDFDPLVTNR